jgi:glycerol-3-phosphate O-acyltransferase
VFWGQTPDSESSPWKLLFADSWAVTGRLRRLLSIIILGRKTRVQFSAPIHLRELIEHNKGHERTVRMAQRLLRVHFRNLKTAVIGPDISHRRNLVKGLVTTHWCARPSRRGRAREHPLAKAKAQALRYGNEIASDYTYTAIRFLEVVLSWFWNKIYDGIKVNHIEQVQGIAQGHEVIYVPCHRSHIDYLLLSYLLFRNGLTPPHIAAGINLNMPVIGGLLRRGGAFFMRRTFKGNPLYTSVFNEYLHTLFTKGFPVEYFVEGGRSRTGRMLQPKPGCWRSPCAASCVRRARRSCSCRCTSATSACWKAAPTWANCAARARRKSRSSTSSRSSARSSSALARCGQLRRTDQTGRFPRQQQPGWREQDWPAVPPGLAQRNHHRLGETVARHLNEAAAINPVNLVALALLSTSRLALDERALARVLDLYLALLRQVPYSPHTTLPEGDGQALIEACGHGPAGRAEGRPGPHPVPGRSQRGPDDLLPQQRAAHLRPAGAAGELLPEQLAHEPRTAGPVHALYPYLQAELFLRWTPEQLDEVIDQWLAALVEQGLLRFENDVYLRPAPSSRQFVLLTLLARTITQTLQRFYMATSLLLNSGQNSLSAEELEDLCVMMAQRLSILHGLNAPEFFDKTLFRHFIQTLLRKACCAATRKASWVITTSSANWPRAWPSVCCRRSCACRFARWPCTAMTTGCVT